MAVQIIITRVRIVRISRNPWAPANLAGQEVKKRPMLVNITSSSEIPLEIQDIMKQ